MKHSAQFYSVLKQRDKLLEGLLACLKDEDPNVRKGASYAVGNAAYHSSELYLKLKPTIPVLIELLRDPISKTKANAASACGNMALHSNTLGHELKRLKVIQILIGLACNDQHHSVQISSLLALRSLSHLDDLKKEMLTQKAIDKLNSITVANTPRPSSSVSRAHSVLGASFQSSHGGSSSSTVYNHCSKLIRILQGGKS